MNDYPLQYGQKMVVRSNSFGLYEQYAHRLVCLKEVVSTKEGIIAHCWYVENHQPVDISIPLFLLWRIADEEDLLEIHENFIHSKNLQRPK
ncbi:MAG: hypothetical protein JWO32_2045 [Bacteroidetes bacterium]|nr:hypothetical protein [Bacteroidota bacterium]